MTNISKLVFGRQMSMLGHVAKLPSERTLITGSFLVAILRGGVVVGEASCHVVKTDEGLLSRG